MADMNDRKRGFENKFAHDAELRFKAEARRNKLLGLWAADQMGRSDKDAYAKEVVMADFEEAGDEDVFRKVRGDFDAADVTVDDMVIREKMVELMGQAITEVSE